jgi:hypothetical protein
VLKYFRISNSVLSTRYSALLPDHTVRPHQNRLRNRDADLPSGLLDAQFLIHFPLQAEIEDLRRGDRLFEF